MSRQNMTSPISVLLAGVIVIILLLASSDANTSAITRQQNAFQDDEIANAYPAGTASAYVPPANRTTVITGTAPITGTVGTGTSTAGGTHSPTPGTPTPTLTRSANPNGSTELPSEATQPDEAIATLSPTPIDAFTCTPGVPVEIAGDGPPRAPLLLYFDERPVGGGSVAPNGRFALKLIVGQERAGEYKVTVRVRGTSQSLRQVTCSVPNVTPTPLPGTLGR